MITSRPLSTPDGRTVRLDGSAPNALSQVLTEVKAPAANAPQDALEDARNAKPAPGGQKAIDLLSAELNAAAMDFLDITRTTSDAEDLTVYVKDEAQLEKVGEWLISKGYLDQPRTGETSARFEFHHPELEGGDVGDTTLRVAVQPSVDDAKAALVADLPAVMAAAGLGGAAEVAVNGEKLVLKVDGPALDALRTAAGGSFMRAAGAAGLSFMGRDIQLAAREGVTVGTDLSPEERKAVTEQLGAEWKKGSAIQLRLMDGVAVGPDQEVCGFKAAEDGSFTLRYRPLEPVGGPFQELSSEDLFKQGGELIFKPRVEVTTLPPETRAAIGKGWVDWIANTGMIPIHEDWHSRNGSGGTRGPGSGELFMQFHAEMMEGYKAHLKELGRQDLLDACNGDLPVWDTAKDLPDEFGFADQARKNIGWTRPAWLTIDGAKPGQPTFRLDGREIKSLNDLRTPDEVGRALGTGPHGVGHNQLSGQMAGFKSVGVGAFMLWHGLMEVIRNEWSRTDSGQAWLAQHPSGWTKPRDIGAADHAHMGHDMNHDMGADGPRITDEQFRAEMKMLSDRALKAQ